MFPILCKVLKKRGYRIKIWNKEQQQLASIFDEKLKNDTIAPFPRNLRENSKKITDISKRKDKISNNKTENSLLENFYDSLYFPEKEGQTLLLGKVIHPSKNDKDKYFL